MKLFVLLLLAWIGWKFWRRLGDRAGAKNVAEESPCPAAAETMQVCAHCGVHVPESEMAHDAAGRAYCSVAHRRLGAKL